MAEKILQTRIINKHAELESWKLSTLPLKEGEIALAKVMVKQPDGTEAPTYVAKIGLEGKTFSESPMLFAPASDVYSWAKASEKPAYAAGEIARGTSTVAADLSAAEEAIQALQDLIGFDVSVADLIKAAIEGLDVADEAVANQFVTAVAEADGKISVTRRALSADDIPELAIAKIAGLQDELDAKASESDFTEYVNTNNLAVEAAQDAADAAQAAADAIYKVDGDTKSGVLATYMTTNDAALAEVKATAEAARTETEVDGQIEAKLATFKSTEVTPLVERVAALETTAGELVDDVEDIEGRLTTAEGAIATLNAATTFAGTGTYAQMNALENVKAGSIFVVIDTTETGKQYNNKEFVFDGAKWVELGDTTAELTEINALKERVSKVEGDVVTAQSTADQGVADAATAQAAAEAAQEDATSALEKLDIVQGDDTVEGSIAYALKAAKGYTDSEIDKVEETVNTLTQTVGANKTEAATATKKVADALAAYVESNDAAVAAAKKAGDDAQTYAEGVNTALESYKTENNKAVTANQEAAANNAANIATIQANYARVEGDKLVYGQGESVMTIIFDCGNEIA